MTTILFYSFIALCFRLCLDGIFIGLMAAGRYGLATLVGATSIPLAVVALPFSLTALVIFKLGTLAITKGIALYNERQAQEFHANVNNTEWFRASDISGWHTHKRLEALPHKE